GINRDLTELKEACGALEDSKADAEFYIELLGHDINNMTQIALGYLELALDDPELKMNVKDMLERSGEALMNSVKLIDNVRKSRQSRLNCASPEPIDIGAMLSQVIEQ